MAWQVPKQPSKKQIWTFMVENCKESAMEHSIEKSVSHNLVNLSAAFSTKLFEEIYFHS